MTFTVINRIKIALLGSSVGLSGVMLFWPAPAPIRGIWVANALFGLYMIIKELESQKNQEK